MKEQTSKIEQVFLYVGTDHDGTEGIISAEIQGQHMPLVFSNASFLDDIDPIAKKIGKKLGIEIKLLKFTNRQEYNRDLEREF